MAFKSIILLLGAAALLNVCTAQGPVIDWLKNNPETTKAAELLQMLYKKPVPNNAKFTLLAPTNSVRSSAPCAVCVWLW